MSERISKKNVEALFNAFVKAIGGHIATNYNDIGGYDLNYSQYGGFEINRIMNDSGGLTQPFGMTRRKTTEMYYTLSFAIKAIEEARRLDAKKAETPDKELYNVCDYGHDTQSAIRRLPTSGGAAVLVCREHYQKEIAWRKAENARGVAYKYDLPTWDSLELVAAPIRQS